MLTNARRRWPAVEFRVVNVAGAGPDRGARRSSTRSRCSTPTTTIDVIVIARGGGSVEDLLPFSDEALCRAVFACRTPVVSAIGHETDAPLVDYVADVRASTPTDAAKRIVPDLGEEIAADRAWPAAGSTGRCAPCSTGSSTASTRCARGPSLARPELMVDQRAADVAALRDRAARCLEHRLRRADDDLRHTAGPAARAVPGRHAPARLRDRAARRRPRGARGRARSTTGDPLRVRLAEGELARRRYEDERP